MFNKTILSVFSVLVVMLLLISGCSDKKTTQPTAETSALQLVDLDGIVRAVAPPEFSAPSTSPNGNDAHGVDSVWLYGQYPLVGKVFGSDDPQTLYANIRMFKMFMSIVSHSLRVDANNQPILGVYNDSVLVSDRGNNTMVHYAATVTALTQATTIPTVAQAVIGTTVDVNYLISITVDEFPDGQVKLGLALSDTAQTLCEWEGGMEDVGDQGSRLVYSSLDPRDSSFVFKGVGYVMHEGGEIFTYAFNMEASASADFTYRMSWYSNNFVGGTLSSINGGGNKDVEFGLISRNFHPADSTDCDSNQTRAQVFGPNYVGGTSLVSAYAAYFDESLIFHYDALPHEMLTDPWTE